MAASMRLGLAVANKARRQLVLKLGQRARHIGFGRNHAVHGLRVKRHFPARLQGIGAATLHHKPEGIAAITFFGVLAIRCTGVGQAAQQARWITRISGREALVHRDRRWLKAGRSLGARFDADRPQARGDVCSVARQCQAVPGRPDRRLTR